jgi:hypothetical protein
MGTVNFDNVENNEFSPIPEDRYNFECIKAELKESKAGNPKITAQFRIIDGKYENRRIFNDFSLMSNALFNLKTYFEKAGVEIPSGEINHEELVDLLEDTQVTGFVEIKTYGDKKSNTVGRWGNLDTKSSNSSLFS